MDKSCCFFGHRDMFEQVDEQLFLEILKLVDKGVCYFYVGGMGDFDKMAGSAVRSAKQNNPDIKLYLIKPYFSNELNTNKWFYEDLYDDVVIPSELADTFYKAAIKKRNRWMVDKCDYVICYIRRDHGGAFDAVKYAVRQGKTIINIYNDKK